MNEELIADTGFSDRCKQLDLRSGVFSAVDATVRYIPEFNEIGVTATIEDNEHLIEVYCVVWLFVKIKVCLDGESIAGDDF